MSDITRILSQIEQGDSNAVDKLLPLVYEELRALAEIRLRRESSSKSMQPTLLVHEAYLRLVDQDGEQEWNSKGHFFAAAAEAMRRILVEHARRKQSQKRGGGWRRVPLEHLEPEDRCMEVDLLDLEDALKQLEQQFPAHAKLVTLKHFAGLTNAEVAQAMAISQATAERYWAFARAWLFNYLNSENH